VPLVVLNIVLFVYDQVVDINPDRPVVDI